MPPTLPTLFVTPGPPDKQLSALSPALCFPCWVSSPPVLQVALVCPALPFPYWLQSQPIRWGHVTQTNQSEQASGPPLVQAPAWVSTYKAIWTSFLSGLSSCLVCGFLATCSFRFGGDSGLFPVFPVSQGSSYLETG